jgi:hemolysin activation/secretion protein
MQKTFRFAALSAAVLMALPALAQVRPDAGQTLQQLTPQQPAPTQPGATVQIQTPAATDILPGGQKVALQSIKINGATVIAESDLLAAIGEFEGQSFDMAGLRGLALKVSSRYRDAGYPFARAFIPPQSLANGALVIEVIEGQYGAIQTNGEEPFKSAAEPYFARLQQGQVIESTLLERITLLVDDLPGVAITPVMKPGAKVGTGDLDVKVERTNPQEFQVGLDNHGNYYSGEWRARASVNLNSPFLMGDQLSASALYSQENLWLLSLNYAAPVGHNGLRANVGYAETSYNLGKTYKALGVKGTAKVSTVGVSYPVIRSQQSNLNLSASFQEKRLYNEFNGIQASKYKVETTPLSLQFDHRDTFAGGAITFGNVTWTHGDLRRAANEDNAQPGGFKKWNLDLVRLQSLGGGNFSLYGRLSTQSTTENLDSSEKISLGGPAGVRAYPTGEASGDEGWFTQIELRYNMGENVPFVFYDEGKVKVNAESVVMPEPDKKRAGIGFGNRFNNGPWSLETVLAWRTRGGIPESVEGKDPKPRFWVNASYKF